jgi:hypothetical protein
MPKTKVKPAKEKTVSEQIIDLFNQYLDTTSAILTDYVADPGMLVELSCADKNFIEEIEALQEEMDSKELTFDDLTKKLSEVDDFDNSAILDLCDPELAADWFSNEGYAIVKIQTLDQRTKLEDFVTTEIYPHENDKNNYNI